MCEVDVNMYKVNMIANCNAEKFVNIIKSSKDLVIKKKKKNYIITAFVSGDDMQQMLDIIDETRGLDKFQKIMSKMGTSFNEHKRSHCMIIPFKFNIEDKNEKCIINGHFRLIEIFMLLMFFVNLMFLFGAIVFLFTVLVPIFIVVAVGFFDIMMIKEVELYAEFVLKTMTNELHDYDIDIYEGGNKL